MIFIEIPEKNQTLYFPEDLGECDALQFSEMAKLIYHFNKGEMNYDDFKVLSVYALLNLKMRKRNHHHEKKLENITRLSELVESFFDKVETEEGTKIYLKNYAIENHLPSFWFFRKFYGPSYGFMKTSYGEYSDATDEFINYSLSGDEKHLYNLFAIFYRLKNEEYDLDKCKKRAEKLFRYIDIRKVYGFYLLFEAFQKFVSSGEITIHGKVIDLSIIYESVGNTTSSLPGIGLQGVINSIAESGVFGIEKEVRKTSMWKVILRMYELKVKEIELKKESKS